MIVMLTRLILEMTKLMHLEVKQQFLYIFINILCFMDRTKHRPVSFAVTLNVRLFESEIHLYFSNANMLVS